MGGVSATEGESIGFEELSHAHSRVPIEKLSFLT